LRCLLILAHPRRDSLCGAQVALLERARLNGAARDGRYDPAMEAAGRQPAK